MDYLNIHHGKSPSCNAVSSFYHPGLSQPAVYARKARYNYKINTSTGLGTKSELKNYPNTKRDFLESVLFFKLQKVTGRGGNCDNRLRET